MMESSFAPVPGAEADGIEREVARPRPYRWMRSNRPFTRSSSLGFAQYTSSRTVLAGGCPALSDDVAARPRRRSS